MSILRRRAAFGAAGTLAIVLAAAVMAWIGGASRGSAAVRPTVNEVAQGLTCQCGCGLTVANCNHPTCEFAVPARAQIRKMIDQGRTRAEIIAFYREKYGEKVLSAPTTQGFNLLAWIMPFAAVAIGGVFIGFAARRWRSNGTETPAGDSSRPREGRSQVDADLKRRLDDEVRENR
jgi:cytochrome c-type biogenesis protein CcmH/NrfF